MLDSVWERLASSAVCRFSTRSKSQRAKTAGTNSMKQTVSVRQSCAKGSSPGRADDEHTNRQQNGLGQCAKRIKTSTILHSDFTTQREGIRSYISRIQNGALRTCACSAHYATHSFQYQKANRHRTRRLVSFDQRAKVQFLVRWVNENRQNNHNGRRIRDSE